MLNISSVKTYMQDYFSVEPRLVNRSLSNFLNKLIAEYKRYSKELDFVKGISKGWLKSIVNRKVMASLVQTLRSIKAEILSLINSHSKFRNQYNM